jgi:hypothetical protein
MGALSLLTRIVLVREQLVLPSVRDFTRTKSSWWAYTIIAPK